MNAFRSFTPKRRKITTSVKHHGDHRADLKLDYKDRCGWCNDIDTWRVTWFEIDHFVPQKYLKKISFNRLKHWLRHSNLRVRHLKTRERKRDFRAGVIGHSPLPLKGCWAPVRNNPSFGATPLRGAPEGVLACFSQ